MAANIVAAAAAAQEVDPMLKKAIKLLHSTNPTSASELRLLLDEALKLRFGPEKMISKNMSQRMMDDEANFPGRATPQPPAQAMATDEIINLTNSPDKVPSDSPDTIADSDDGSAGGLAMSGVVNTGDTGDFGDLNCCVCGEMVFTATNRLIECSKCGALYHQECHKPPISNEEASDDQEHIWQCDNCCSKPSTSRSAGTTAIVAPTPTLTPTPTPTVIIPDEPMPVVSKPKSSVPSSRSSTSSNSSSPFYKPEVSSSTNASSSSGSKHGHKSSSSSSSKSHKEDRSSKSVAHSLSTISAPEKHTSGSSSSGTSSSRRGSSNTKSSSSKSKHHESSSSKRRSK